MATGALKFPEPFSNDTRFLQAALATYLREHHLPRILFYELSREQQSEIMDRAQKLKSRRTARGHEGARE